MIGLHCHLLLHDWLKLRTQAGGGRFGMEPAGPAEFWSEEDANPSAAAGMATVGPKDGVR